jgi:hypothetical protein
MWGREQCLAPRRNLTLIPTDSNPYGRAQCTGNRATIYKFGGRHELFAVVDQ